MVAGIIVRWKGADPEAALSSDDAGALLDMEYEVQRALHFYTNST